ncbi:MAG: Ku protein [Dehalococcoidia bacterium]|jgi:DNA end-binding protein Ku
MMARAFWKGVISFGMVAIPVKMYVATQVHTTSFHILHKKCLSRLKQMWYCPVDNEYLPLQDTARGYEYAPGQYAVLEESDFKKVPLKTLHSISIAGFVDAGEIDPIYFQGSHYLEPDELGVKPFSLLRQTLLNTGRIGIAKVTFQRQEHLCCLRPFENIMMLHTIHYQADILPRDDLKMPVQELSKDELKMASTLVEAMTKKFKPEDFRDEYHEALKKVIDARVKGLEIKAPREQKAAVKDLMEALRTSIETARKATAAAGRAK